jgi:hypothetical protein
MREGKGLKRKAEKVTGVSDIPSYELELEKKKKQLLTAKSRYRKLAGEYIDLWVKANKERRK